VGGRRTTRTDAETIAPAIERLLAGLARRRFGEIEPSPLTTTQQIMLAIVVEDGPLRLRDLARRIGTTPATATRSTDALEIAGLVERKTDPTDGRGVLVGATPKGRRTQRKAHATLVTVLERMLDQMDLRNRERFISLMSDVLDVVEETDRELRPGAASAAAPRVA
jgi:DNA-binding MarR family transcriptional regulator